MGPGQKAIRISIPFLCILIILNKHSFEQHVPQLSTILIPIHMIQSTQDYSLSLKQLTNSIMIDEGDHQQGGQNKYTQYQHITQYFVTWDVKNLAEIGKCLGYNAFPQNHILNLYKKYHFRKFNTICQLCSAINLEGLILNFNEAPNILKDIVITIYPKLQVLDLSGNLIQSIEPLSRLVAPNLFLLNLSGNFISNLRSLQRIYFQNLTVLDLTTNSYREIPEMVPGLDVSFDRRVINKSKIYKIIFTRKQILNSNVRRRMMDYFA